MYPDWQEASIHRDAAPVRTRPWAQPAASHTHDVARCPVLELAALARLAVIGPPTLESPDGRPVPQRPREPPPWPA